jgi:hypothetical protein
MALVVFISFRREEDPRVVWLGLTTILAIGTLVC